MIAATYLLVRDSISACGLTQPTGAHAGPGSCGYSRDPVDIDLALKHHGFGPFETCLAHWNFFRGV